MNKPLPKVGIVAASILGVLALAAVMFWIGGGEPPAKSPVSSPYTKVGVGAPNAGVGVNSLTGEPLPDTAKSYADQSWRMQRGSPPAAHR